MNQEEYDKIPFIRFANSKGFLEPYKLILFTTNDEGIEFNTGEGKEFSVPFEKIKLISGMTIWLEEPK